MVEHRDEQKAAKVVSRTRCGNGASAVGGSGAALPLPLKGTSKGGGSSDVVWVGSCALCAGRTSIGGGKEGSADMELGTTSGRGVSPEPDSALHGVCSNQVMTYLASASPQRSLPSPNKTCRRVQWPAECSREG